MCEYAYVSQLISAAYVGPKSIQESWIPIEWDEFVLFQNSSQKYTDGMTYQMILVFGS